MLKKILIFVLLGCSFNAQAMSWFTNIVNRCREQRRIKIQDQEDKKLMHAVITGNLPEIVNSLNSGANTDRNFKFHDLHQVMKDHILSGQHPTQAMHTLLNQTGIITKVTPSKLSEHVSAKQLAGYCLGVAQLTEQDQDKKALYQYGYQVIATHKSGQKVPLAGYQLPSGKICLPNGQVVYDENVAKKK